MIVAIVARRLHLPYTVGLVLSGLALAFSRFDVGLHLTHEVVFDLILPPLLFEAALNLHARDLRRDWPPIVALAFVGVVLGAAVVAGGLYLLGWPLKPALAFGALISATDPIAVIALLRERGMTGRLAILIESESLANDGAAAVLFALATMGGLSGDLPGVGETVTSFFWIAGGGVLIGAAIAGAALLLVWRTEEYLVETAITAVAAYGSFLVAERFGASGVLATVTAGLVLGNLGVLAEEPRVDIHHRARTRIGAEILGVRRLSRQFLRVPADRARRLAQHQIPARLAPSGRRRTCADRPRGGGLSRQFNLRAYALEGDAAAAAFPLVGRVARRAGAGARLDAAATTRLIATPS